MVVKTESKSKVQNQAKIRFILVMEKKVWKDLHNFAKITYML